MSTRSAGKSWLALVLALMAAGAIGWAARFFALPYQATVSKSSTQAVSLGNTPAGPVTVACPDGNLVMVREFRPEQPMESFYIDLLGTGTPQKMDLHPVNDGSARVPGYKLVISQGRRTLASFTLTGQWGQVYVASLREKNKPELVAVLYGGNAVAVNDFKIIGDNGKGRIETLMNSDDLPDFEKNSWSVEGKALITDYQLPSPNYTGPNGDRPYLSYRRTIRWNPDRNRFEVSEATPAWSADEEYRKMSQEAFAQVSGLTFRQEDFPDEAVTKALFLDYGATKPQGFRVDLDGSGKLTEVIAIPDGDFGQSVYVLQKGALPVHLWLGGETLTCYAVHLRDGKTTELVFLTEQGAKGDLWAFVMVGMDGQKGLAILSRGEGVTRNVTGSTLETRGRKLIFRYRIRISPAASGLSMNLRPMIEEQQEIWWDQETQKIWISRPH